MLPKWAKDNRTAVLEEAAPYRNLSPQERLELLRRVVKSGARQLAGREDRLQLLAFRDPLPKSSEEGLARLGREYKAHGGHLKVREFGPA